MCVVVHPIDWGGKDMKPQPTHPYPVPRSIPQPTTHHNGVPEARHGPIRAHVVRVVEVVPMGGWGFWSSFDVWVGVR
jgi:hypothetical protein